MMTVEYLVHVFSFRLLLGGDFTETKPTTPFSQINTDDFRDSLTTRLKALDFDKFKWVIGKNGLRRHALTRLAFLVNAIPSAAILYIRMSYDSDSFADILMDPIAVALVVYDALPFVTTANLFKYVLHYDTRPVLFESVPFSMFPQLLLPLTLWVFWRHCLQHF